jgi:hypothetical protein
LRQKNDAADVKAICEAAQRPTMRFVLVKSEAAPLYSELDEAARGRRDNPDCGGRQHRGRDRLRPPTGRNQLDICPDEVGPPVPASERHRRPQISFLGVTGLFETPAKSGERRLGARL